MKISVLIADDHKIFRQGLAVTLKAHRMHVVGQAADGEEAILMARKLKPHVILMDVDMPIVDGVVATWVIKQHVPSSKVLMLSALDQDERILEAMKVGASGYLLKQVSPEDLVETIKACVKGEIFISPYLANRVLGGGLRGQNQAKSTGVYSDLLSPQEQKILKLIVEGLCNKEIAEALHISLETVKTHLKHIFEKLHVDSRTKAAMAAVEKSLISPDPSNK